MGAEADRHGATEPPMSGYGATMVCGLVGCYGFLLVARHNLRPFGVAVEKCDYVGPECDGVIPGYLVALVVFFSITSLFGGLTSGIGAWASGSGAWLEVGIIATAVLLVMTWLSAGLLILLGLPAAAGLAMSHQLGVRWHERRTQTKEVFVSEEEHTLASSERGDVPGQ